MNSIKIFLKKVISLERLYKQLIVFLNDCLICIICIWLSFSTRYETLRIPNEYEIIIYIIALLIFIPVFYFFKIYKIIHEHLGFSSLRQIILLNWKKLMPLQKKGVRWQELSNRTFQYLLKRNKLLKYKLYKQYSLKKL